ncbi:MAG: hypothetical protein CL931_05385 [Deltaproteobacteria bacterium]|nr:hypothetical protein [Deltaproteobacteria bacterium]
MVICSSFERKSIAAEKIAQVEGWSVLHPTIGKLLSKKLGSWPKTCAVSTILRGNRRHGPGEL